MTDSMGDRQGPLDPAEQELGKAVTWGQHDTVKSIPSAIRQAPSRSLSQSLRTVTRGTGVMALSVTCGFTKHEYLPAFRSPAPMKKLRMVVSSCKTSAVDIKTGGAFPRAHWPSSLTIDELSKTI